MVYFLLSKELGAEALSDQHGFQHPGLETALLDRLRLGHLIVCNRSNRREHGRRALSRLPYRNAIRLRDRNRERRTPVTMSASTSGLDDSAEEIAGLVERVTRFNEESGYAVLRANVRGGRD